MLDVKIGRQLNIFLENVGLMHIIETDDGGWNIRFDDESSIEKIRLTRRMKSGDGFYTQGLDSIFKELKD